MTDAAKIELLVALACSDAEVLADLDGCVTRLHAVQQATAAGSRLDAESLRNVLGGNR